MNFRSTFRMAALALCCAAGLQAQVSSWNVASGNWSTPTNWTPNGTPANNGTADIFFSNAGTATSNVDTAWTISTIIVEDPQGPLTLTGAEINFSAGSIVNESSSTTTITNMLYSTGAEVFNSGTGTLTLSNSSNSFAAAYVTHGILTDGAPNSFGGGNLLVDSPGQVVVAFNETVANIQNSAGGGSIVIDGGATLSIGVFSAAWSGVISGAGNLEKLAPSTQTLTGTSTYTGTTVIDSGGTIQLGNGTTNGSINSTSGVSGAGSLSFDFSGSVTVPESLTGSLNVVQTAGTTTLSGNNSYSGTTTVNGGTLQAGSTTAFGGTGNSAVSVGSSGTLAIGGFDNQVGSLAGPGTVVLGANTLTVGNIFAGPTVFSGMISGTGGLTMSGYVLDLTNGNTYSGATTVNAGTLEADNSSGFATGTGTITINGGTLQIGNVDNHGAINLNDIADNGGQVAIARTDTMTFPNNISGAGGVEVAGGGTGNVTLSGNNTYSGPTYVYCATLTAGSSTPVGASSDVSLNSSTLNLNSHNISVGSLTADSGSAVLLGSQTLTLTGSLESNFGASMSGTGGLVANGTGEFAILGAVTYTGGTTIGPSGFVSLGINSGPGASMVGNVVDNGIFQFAPYVSDNYLFTGAITGSGQVQVAGSGTVTLENSEGNTYTGITDLISATLTDSVPFAFSPFSRMFLYTGATLLVTQNEAVGDLENGSGGGIVNIASGKTLTIEGVGQPLPFTGTISGAGGVNIDTGPNSQGFGGANTYSGVTTMTSGEIFVASSTVGLPGSITSGPIGTNTLVFNGNAELSSINSNITLANAINLNDFNLDNDDATTNLTITGPISGVGGSITWCTNNLLALTNTNTFTGGVDMREGQLGLGSDTGAGVGGTIILDSGSELYTYGGTGITRTVANPINFTGSEAQLGNSDDNNLVLQGAISGSGAVIFQGGSTGSLTLSPSSNTFSGTFDLSSGTVYAANNNAFGSATEVSLTGSTTLNVENGVTVSNPIFFSGSPNTLAGSGTISSFVAAAGSTVISPSSPSGGPATLAFSNGLTLATGSAIHFDIDDASGTAGTGFSLISVTGGLTLTASANTITFNIVSTDSSGNAANAMNFSSGSSYSWMFATSSSAITTFNPNQFNLVTGGFTNPIGVGSFNVSQTGNNLYLNFTPVPEPSTWALMGAGVAVLAVVGLRRMRLARV